MQNESVSRASSASPGVLPADPEPRPSTLVHQPPRISDHELLRCIGRGSYGEVWLARTVLDEYRAVKVVHRHAFGDNRPFEREFEGIQRYEPVSRSHPSQVQILHVGINPSGGYFYYVMELADDAAPSPNDEIRNPNTEGHATQKGLRASAFGIPSDFGIRNSDLYVPRTLRQELERHGRLPLGQCIQIGLELTTALEHLHRHGLVHRDVKPSNIIFVGGVPKLADIGLVTEAGDGKSIVGTEGYLAPEGPGSASADLYGLGKVLYEISSARDRRHFPDLPLDLQDWPDRQGFLELNEVLLKACAHDLRQRYQTAAAMRADLEVLQRGESVRRRRATQRRFLIAKELTLAAAVLGLLSVGTWLLSNGLSQRAARPDPQPIGKKLTTNLDALNAYAQGRYAYNKNTGPELTNAIGCFERAIALDPNLAEAYAGLASSYVWGPFMGSGSNLEGMAKAKAMAQKALALNPNLPEAHKCMAIVAYFLDWRWAEAEAEFKLAMQLEPRDGETLRAYGFYLKCMGRIKEAITLLTRARESDPRSLSAAQMLGSAFFAAGEYEQAMKQYQTRIDMEPDAPSGARGGLANIYEEQGRFLEAIALYEEDDVLSGDNTEANAQWYRALREGYRTGATNGYWQKWLEWEKAEPSWSPYNLARLHARLGQKQAALDCLKEACEKHDHQLVVNLKTDRAIESLRREPQFIAVLKKMNWE